RCRPLAGAARAAGEPPRHDIIFRTGLERAGQILAAANGRGSGNDLAAVATEAAVPAHATRGRCALAVDTLCWRTAIKTRTVTIANALHAQPRRWVTHERGLTDVLMDTAIALRIH